MFTTPAELMTFIKENAIVFVDVRFCDLHGVQQHFNIPADSVDEEFFSVGQLFDGSSIAGFAQINESDLQLIPDVTTAYVDPFRAEPTLIVIFDIYDPRTGEIFHRDPRQVAKKAEKYLASTGIADTAFFASEAEFYLFDSVRHEVSAHRSFYEVDSDEGYWNSAAEDDGNNLGNKIPLKRGYFPVPPTDKQADIRDAISVTLMEAGLKLERAHHEVGTGGQAEINYRFDTLVAAADDLLKFKYPSRASQTTGARLPHSCRNPSPTTTVRGCTPTSRCGRTANRCSMTRPATHPFLTPHAGTSEVFSSTPTRWPPSPTRRRTRTDAW